MKIAIDPGHGMSNKQPGVYDPGAMHRENGFSYQEADIALRYGLSLRDVIRARGHQVFMTRDDATDHMPVGKRAAAAKAAGCQTLVSLHLNDAEVDTAHGLEVLYRDDKVLAEKLQARLVQVTGLRDRGAKPRPDLAVLKFAGLAVLVELGFIANDGDRNTLLDPAMREKICEAIADIVLS
ncbi:N-acetylmuramoyl-L-alanine amidase [Chitinivorax tropicus]|uniref:N-acetylmuramoyl-L-alanine amidase n=1 Tax=Chitinivorax tropicus TaxID=714531 RepID=A0A840MNT9_9PROT|nr:N-acetylmuramoyl-L-alanine amidase [Chitinivorax tropicus]MBB5019135.1 N-acetylmuramoyl-L-alanine amidase [Chitinivorax tropicus]